MKQLCLIVALILLLPINVDAQVDWPYFDDNTNTILIPKKSHLFPLGWGEDTVRAERDHKAKINRDREVSNYLHNKALKFSKNIELPVVGFAKLDSQQSKFDYYIVEYENKLYYLAASDCPDNTLIENKNNSIVDRYEELKEEIESLSEQYAYQTLIKKQEYESRVRYLENNKQHVVDSLSEGLIANMKADYDQKYEAWVSSVDAQTKRAASIIRINSAYLDSPNTAAGCDYILRYTNTGKKTIKYLNWSGTTYNDVHDKVYCTIRHTCSFNGKDTGPVEPGQTSGGVWEAIIYNWSATELRLNTIVITYMDGSSVSIPGKVALEASNAPNMERLSYDIDGVKYANAVIVDSEIKRLKRATQDMTRPEFALLSPSPELESELAIYARIKELASELRQLKKNNYLPQWSMPESVKRLKLVDLQGI